LNHVSHEQYNKLGRNPKKRSTRYKDYDLGEVHEVEPDIVVTKKGVLDKDKFYLPKSLVDRFDGDKILFSISKENAEFYRKD
jgi:hypothetical protein